MTNTNATNFRKNAFEYFNQAVVFGETINVNTKHGNAIVLSEEEYRGMVETMYLMSHPKTVREILEAREEDPAQGQVYDPAEEW